ncbi:hypothetical protein N9W89_14485 [Hellea sp.]|nr:hypothetical protein [Hellea sp.]
MIRDYIVKTASVLLLVGLACGLAGQVELLKPRVSFMSPSLWPKLLTLHIWATAISLVVIVLSTISLIRDRTALGQWAIWLGFGAVPLLFGILINLTLANVQSPQSALEDTVYLTANRHAYGTAALLVALGGLSALQQVKFKSLSLKVSFGFALLITGSGVALALLQALLGLNGFPRRYIDYPIQFAPFQFYSSVAAITCFFLSANYVILLWRHSNKKAGAIDEVF